MIEFKPDINGNTVVYNAYEEGKNTGRVLLTVEKTKAVLESINAVDDETAEGLMRSALNAAANRDGYSCTYKPEEFRNVATLLGFRNENGILVGEIPFLLTGSCCGCTNKCQ